MLEMPYRGDGLSMVVLLPKKVDGLSELAKSPSLERLEGVLSNLAAGKLSLFVPRFKLEAEFGLRPTLETLGMKLAFSQKADLAGISEKEDLYVSAVVHKAFVDVNEVGTEAAAATGVMVGAMAAPPHPVPTFLRITRSCS